METQSEQILHTEYSDIMQKSYIDYAMSVIIARALPDVRDGLKPVQRRTLYDMYELGIRFDRPYRKCARIVGDTMGKYHPHGDSSIYGALVVMAQEFKYGMPLVDGHGNFGSIEGDGAAAMRYTEARLQKVTQKAYLADLDKDVVDFIPNFDATEREPAVLPVRVPNILVNGAEGIAVGMVTAIPPHNLGEVIDGMIAYMKNPDITTREMLEVIPGPDFPTGGIVINKSDLEKIYETGNGKIRLRGKVEVEKTKGGKERLVITEIPYTMIGANIGKFLNDVYALVETKKTTDITDISNQSSKEGIRIVLELRKGADVQHLCSLLYSKTRLEDAFGVNMLAVANGRPETMGLVAVIRHSVQFQYETASRKYRYLLKKERQKQEIQEGLIEACDVMDLIIEILRGSRSRQQVKDCLVSGNTEGIRFRREDSRKEAAGLHFTERQADAILDMRLYKLIGLEIEALLREHEETVEKIAFYEKVLGSRAQLAKVLMKELKELKKEFARPRRTIIEDAAAAVYEEKAPDVVPAVFLMDRFGYVRAVDVPTYERNREAATEQCRFVVPADTGGRIGLFTESGQLHVLKMADVPLKKFRDKGIPADNISNYSSSSESLAAVHNLEELKEKQLLFVTKDGMIKRVEGAAFADARRGAAATKLGEGDSLLLAAAVSEGDSLVLCSDRNYFLRLPVSEIPQKKKGAIGVRGMRLAENEKIRAAWVLPAGAPLTVTVQDKEVALHRLRTGKRDSRGTKR